MKSGLISTLLFLAFIIFLSSSTKNTSVSASKPVLTPSPCPTATSKSKSELLIGKSWIIHESHELEENSMKKYERGAEDNDVNYDGDELMFTSSNAGEWTDIYNNTYHFTWRFSNKEQTRMEITVQTRSGSFTLYYNTITATDNSFSYSFRNVNTPSGEPSLVSVRRISKSVISPENLD